MSDKIPSTTNSNSSGLPNMNIPSTSAAAFMFSEPSCSGISPELVNKKSSVGESKTIRLTLELFEPNSETFPQYNYSKLVFIEKKKQKKLKQKQETGIGDPFEDNDEDVERIAREMELKYGNLYQRGKSSHKDKALGYDGTDTFIDDTEAYDEKLPDHYEPKERGFYINCGRLEFTSELETDEMVKMVKSNNKKKRVLSTSSEDTDKSSDSESETTESNIEEEAASGSTEQKITKTNESNKISKSNKNGHLEKKHKSNQKELENKSKQKFKITKAPDVNSGTDIVNIVNGNASGSISGIASGNTPVNASASTSGTISGSTSGNGSGTSFGNAAGNLSGNAPANHSGNAPGNPSGSILGNTAGNSKEKLVKTTTVKDMLKARRDSFLKMQDNKNGLKINGMVKSSSNEEDTSSSSSSSESETEPTDKKIKLEDPENDNLHTTDIKLSEDIPIELLGNIKLLIDAARNGNRLGKSFQFDEKFTEMFIKIDDMIDDKNVRNQIFSHIEFQLNLTKNYLCKRSKQIRMKFEKNKTKKAYMKLRKAVNDIMPQIILKYDTLSRKITEQRNAIPPDELSKMENPPKYPKKKFQWTENISNLLFDVYQKRWTSYSVFRSRKESFEDFIKSYLKQELVPIWPVGWMKYEDIKKELEKRKNSNTTFKTKQKNFPEISKNMPSTSSDSRITKSISSTVTSNPKDLIDPSATDKLTNNNISLIKLINQNDTSKLISMKSSSKNTGIIGQSQNENKFSKNITQNPQISKASTKNNTVQVINLESSPKKTDHSITKLISPSKELNSNSSAHIITVDNFLNATDIIQTSNKIIQNTNTNSNNNQVKEHSSKEYKNISKTVNNRRGTVDSLSSGDSDCIVLSPVKEKQIIEDKIKNINAKKENKTQSNLPSTNQTNNKNKMNISNEKESVQFNAKSVSPPDHNSDLDVNFVMESFKDVQRIQDRIPSRNLIKPSSHEKNVKQQ